MSPTPYYQDDHVALYLGDCIETLRALPAESVNCCVTSPPYFGLRDYGTAGQIGLEASPAEYVERLREVFAEVRRVLASDGTLWVNLGDSYSSAGGKSGVGPNAQVGSTLRQKESHTRPTPDRPLKNLLGVPWRVALSLQDDGWILRNDIIWSKPNGMPESVADRLTNKHEHLFMFAKSPRYWFNLDPIREQPVYASGHPALSFDRDTKEADVPGQSMRQHRAGKRPCAPGRNPQALEFGGKHDGSHPSGKNPGDVWTVPTQPFPGAHFAVMPPALVERCIQAGCKSGGTVLDPFSGSGTTGMVAARNGHPYVGIDNNADYLKLSLETRLAQTAMVEVIS